MIRFGRASLPIRCATCSRISASSSSEPSSSSPCERDEGADRLAGVLVGLADHRRLGDLRVGDDRRLDLGGREAVAGDVDHVVDAADHPEVAVGVLARGVADQVGLLAEALEVGLDEALGLLVEGAQHPRPGLSQDEHALLVADLVALVVDDGGVDPGQRLAGGARLRRLGARAAS